MSNATFKYAGLAQKLLREIAVSRLQPGDRLPTEDELVQTHGLSRITVRRALSMLEEGGFISRRRKLGTVVAKAMDSTAELQLVRGAVVAVISNKADSSEADHALASMLRGLESTLADRGFRVQILGIGKDLVQDRARLARIVADDGLEGICAVGPCIEPYLDLTRSVPSIFSCTFTPNGSPWVGLNAEDATKSCSAYLLDHGHRDIAMICGPSLDGKAFARLVTGYRRAFEDRGVPFNRTMLHQAYEGESLHELVEQVLQGTPTPTAVFAQESRVTRAVVDVARRLGKSIPTDLSIMGLGQNTLYVPSPVAITAYVPDNEGVGREAALALVNLIDGHGTPDGPVYIPGKLLERDSVSTRNPQSAR